MQIILILLAAAALYFWQAHYYARHWTESLSANISYSKQHTQIGKPVSLTIELTNQKQLPLPVLYVKFNTSRTFLYQTTENSTVSDHYYRNDVFSIMGNQQVKRTLTFTPTMRGYYTIDQITLVINDLFLRHPDGYNLDNFTELYVFPSPLTDFKSIALTRSLIGDILTKSYQQDPLSFRGIREYSPVDELRFINWKATARQQTLMTNTYFDTQATAVFLLMNLDTNTMRKPQAMKEYMIRLCATFIEHFTRQGFSIALATNGTDVITHHAITVPSGAGVQHSKTLYEALSRIDTTASITNISDYFEGEHSIFHKNQHQISYIILSNYHKPDLCQICYEKQLDGYPIHFVCPEQTDQIAAADFSIVQPDSQTPTGHLQNLHLWEVSENEL